MPGFELGVWIKDHKERRGKEGGNVLFMSWFLPYHHGAQWLNLWLTDFISCPDSHPCSEPFRHGLNYTPLRFLVLQDTDGLYWNVFSSVTTGANNSNLLLIFFLWNTLKPLQIQSSLKTSQAVGRNKDSNFPRFMFCLSYWSTVAEKKLLS